MYTARLSNSRTKELIIEFLKNSTGSPGWSGKNGRKMVVVWWWLKRINAIKNFNARATISTPKRQLHAQEHVIQHKSLRSIHPLSTVLLFLFLDNGYDSSTLQIALRDCGLT